MASQQHDSKVVVFAAMTANGVIAAAKFFAAMMSGSSAMLSEGVHSVADTANEALLLLGMHRAKKPADDAHPFGYGQEIYFWGLIVAIVLFGLGGGISIYEGVLELRRGGELQDPIWSYAVLGIAAVSEGVSWVIAARSFRRKHAGEALWQAFRRDKDPAQFTPLAEDTAALAGIAFAGVFGAHQFGMPGLDAIASVLIGTILAAVALFLAVETKKLLVGESADPELLRRIRAALVGEPGVVDVRQLSSLQLGPDEVLLNVVIRFCDGQSIEDVARLIDRLGERVRSIDPRVCRISIEPEAAA